MIGITFISAIKIVFHADKIILLIFTFSVYLHFILKKSYDNSRENGDFVEL